MSAPGDGEVGAVVLLRPPPGSSGPSGPSSPEDLVAAHIDAATPPPATVDRVARWFRSRGFTVDPPVGPTLTLSGPPELFEQAFGASAPPGGEYPLGALPPDVADHVASVSRPEPPTLY